MTKGFLTFLFICLITEMFSQDNTLDRFYIYDTIIMKNKVAKRIDTVGNDYITEYDALGREIATYRKNDDEIYKSNYHKLKDTIIRLHYVVKGKTGFTPFEIEKYVYNTGGKIKFYLDFKEGFNKRNELNIYKFNYDKKDRISEISTYYNNRYPFTINSDAPIVDTLLKQGIIYHYFYNDSSTQFYKKQMTGSEEFKQIDTFYFNDKGKLLKTVSFQKEGYQGEWPASNIYNIEEFKYEKNKLLIHEFGFDIQDKKVERYNRQIETTYFPNGLAAKISVLEGDERFLGSSFIYKYFKPYRGKHNR